jgi:GAF domain-containing protein
MLTWIKRLTAAPVFEDDEEKTRNAALLNIVLWATLAIIAAAAFPLIFFNETPADVVLSAVMVITFLLLVGGLVLLLHRGRVRLASTLMCVLLLVTITVTIFLFGGLRTTGVAGYLLVVFIAGLLLGGRGLLTFGLCSMLSALGVFCVYYFELNPRPLRPRIDFDDLFMLYALGSMMAVLVGLVRRNIANALERARRNERALVESNLELQISRDALQARTRELERRSRLLQAAAEVTRDATAGRELEDLLHQEVGLIQHRCGFYQVGIYLVDERGEQAVLRAAAGELEHQMLGQEYELTAEEGKNLLSYVISSGRHQVVTHAGPDVVHAEPPASPWTRSEVWLPLRVGGRIIGALDVHSQEETTLDEDEVAVLQTMADQLAVAIENRRLLDEMQQTVRELEIASGRYTEESWRTATQRVDRPPGYRYGHLGIEPITEQPPEARQAWLEGRPVITTTPGGDGRDAFSTLAVPVQLREQVVGVLNLSFEGEAPSSETIATVEEIASRLALALENARLLEETRERAERDRLTADISARVRASMDVETILQTAVRELGTALGTDRAFIQLGLGAQSDEQMTEG